MTVCSMLILGVSRSDQVRDWVAATGSLGAALGAAVAAFFAWRATRASELVARATERDAGAQIRPLLLDVPYEQSGVHGGIEIVLPDLSTQKTPMRGQITADWQRGMCSVPVRNVGEGVAKLVRAELRFRGEPSDAISGLQLVQHIPAASEGRVGFYRMEPISMPEASAAHMLGGIEVWIAYTDYLGEQEQTLKLALGAYVGESAWRVLRAVNE
jgi:hypothetical protein